MPEYKKKSEVELMEKRTVYVVSGRYERALIRPEIFPSKRDAERYASRLILDDVRDYADLPAARKSTLQKWAREHDCQLEDNYFWNGGDYVIETMVTKSCITVKPEKSKKKKEK